MAHLLTSFFREAAGRAWVWGEWDCLHMPAEWVIRVRGQDPAAKWRGSAHTALACERIIQRAGGLVALCDDGLGTLGIQRTERPQPGDWAVVQAATVKGVHLVGGLWATDRDVAILTADKGLVVTSIGFVPVASWGVM